MQAIKTNSKIKKEIKYTNTVQIATMIKTPVYTYEKKRSVKKEFLNKLDSGMRCESVIFVVDAERN